MSPKPAEVPAVRSWTDHMAVMEEWCEELEGRSQSHRRSAFRLRSINRLLGGLNVVTAAIAATAMFAALNKRLENLDVWQQVGITFLAVLPSIASGLQKEWQVAAREQGHLTQTHELRKLLKELQFYKAFPPADHQAVIASWHARYIEVISRPILRAS